MTDTTPGALGPDEKLCPFCAEVIRSAAVKCRYCHSDLPVEPADAELPTAFPAAGTAHDIRETPDQAEPSIELPTGAPEPGAPALTTSVIAMLVVSLVLALGIGAVLLSARSDSLDTAGNGQVTSTSYRSAAMSAAAANAGAVLSYSYKTLAADEKAAREVLTPGFAKKYAEVMAKAGPKATAAKLTLKATVVSTGLVSVENSSAKVLLFVNTVTTAAGSQKQQLTQNRVLMTMKRQDGDWIVSKLTPF